jgi:hypothetical protein
MQYKIEKVKAPNREEVELLKETYETGTPQGEALGRWRQKLASREDKLRYLKNGERYFYSKDAYGSEKRKNLA